MYGTNYYSQVYYGHSGWQLYGETYTIELNDSLGLSDNFAHIRNSFKTLSDSLGLSEAFGKSISRLLLDSLGINDVGQVSNNAGVYGAGYYGFQYYGGKPSTAPADFFSKVKGHNRVFSDSISLSEVFIRSMTKALSDTITLTDLIAKRLNRAFSDTLSIVETFIKGQAKILNETIALTDSMKKATVKILLDSVSLIETFGRLVTRIFSDSLTVSDIGQVDNNGGGYGTGYYGYQYYGGKSLVNPTQFFHKVKGRYITFSDVIKLVESLVLRFNGAIVRWFRIVKTTATYDKIVKATAVFTNVAKQAIGVFTKSEKPTVTYTKQVKTTDSWTKDEKPEV